MLCSWRACWTPGLSGQSFVRLGLDRGGAGVKDEESRAVGHGGGGEQGACFRHALSALALLGFAAMAADPARGGLPFRGPEPDVTLSTPRAPKHHVPHSATASMRCSSTPFCGLAVRSVRSESSEFTALYNQLNFFFVAGCFFFLKGRVWSERVGSVGEHY